eukprot:COSAG06_NODE_35066_length_465_cov_0.693989_1_plen_129_part_01
MREAGPHAAAGLQLSIARAHPPPRLATPMHRRGSLSVLRQRRIPTNAHSRLLAGDLGRVAAAQRIRDAWRRQMGKGGFFWLLWGKYEGQCCICCIGSKRDGRCCILGIPCGEAPAQRNERLLAHNEFAM